MKHPRCAWCKCPIPANRGLCDNCRYWLLSEEKPGMKKGRA